MDDMEYQVVLEFDEDSKLYSASIVGVPDIIVDAMTEADALRLAQEALAFYLEEGGKPPEAGIDENRFLDEL